MEFYSDKFKKIREEKGISIKELSRRTGISRVSIWNWETCKKIPSSNKVKVVAAALNIGVDKISTLVPEVKHSEASISTILKPYMFFNDNKTNTYIQNKEKLKKSIDGLYEDLAQATTIINSILTNIQSMFYIKDDSLKYIMANKTFIENYSSETLGSSIISGKTDSFFFTRKDAQWNSEQDELVLKTGRAIKNLTAYIPGSRKKRWGLISKYPIFDINGNVAGLIATFVDITEQKQAEELHELLELCIKSMYEGFSIYDIDRKKYIFLNNTIEKMYGCSNDDFRRGGREFWINNCVHPEDRDYVKNAYFAEHPEPEIIEYRAIRPDGEVRWIRSQVNTDVSYKGRKCHMSIDVDITISRELHFYNLLEFILDGMPNGFELFEKEGYKPIFANNAVEDIFGYPKDKVLDVDFWVNRIIHPEDREDLLKLLKPKSLPAIRNYRIIKPDGSIRLIETNRKERVFQGKTYIAIISREL